MPDISIDVLGYNWFVAGGQGAQAAAADVRALLRDRKSIKFMAKQDQMAVQTAIHAVSMAGIDIAAVAESTGVYFAIGTIPFEQEPLDILYEKSVEDDCFSMQRFSTQALPALNPLLTFKCLPNMPVFHVSYNLQARGPYYVTYPGAGQWFQALQQAVYDLQTARVRFAIVGAVADQLNPLVRYHVQRTRPQSLDSLVDAACVLVLAAGRAEKSLATLQELTIAYQPMDPLAGDVMTDTARAVTEIDAGAVDPSLFIARQLDRQCSGRETISVRTHDGINASVCLERR